MTPFQHAETKLNTLLFEGLPLGYLITQFFDGINIGVIIHDTRDYPFLVTKNLLKALGKRHYLTDRNASLIYYKSGKSRHHQAMEAAVKMAESPSTPLLVIGPKGASDIPSGHVFFHNKLTDLFHALSFQYRHRKQLKSILDETPLSAAQRRHLSAYLLVQQLKALSALRFLRCQRRLTHLCVDYDRNSEACLLVAAAKQLNLYTVTLQHGIMNPPTGYFPLLAETCLAWGDMSKQQFIELGESAEKIICTGTPILEPITLSDTLRADARDRYGLKPGRTFLLALSGPNRPLDEQLAAFLAAVKTTYGTPDDNFVVKTHPSHPTVDYTWLEQKYGLKHLPLLIPYADVMNLADIVLTHTSGFGAEALHFGKQLGIINIPGYDAVSGLELHKYLGVPLLQEPGDMEPLLTTPTQEAPEARKAKENQSRKLFLHTGKEAAQAIADYLLKIMKEQPENKKTEKNS